MNIVSADRAFRVLNFLFRKFIFRSISYLSKIPGGQSNGTRKCFPYALTCLFVLTACFIFSPIADAQPLQPEPPATVPIRGWTADQNWADGYYLSDSPGMACAVDACGYLGNDGELWTGPSAICPEGYSYIGGDVCRSDVTRFIWPECETCKAGQTPVASTPVPQVGNPVSLDTGSKVQGQRDYATADGLLSIDRQYRNREFNANMLDIRETTREFGRGWGGLFPGTISVMPPLPDPFATDPPRLIARFASSAGTMVQFTPNADGQLSSGDATRLKLTYMSGTPQDDLAFFQEGSPVSSDAEEMRLELSNGDQILFRRNTSFEQPDRLTTFVGRRVLVPVAQILANGYRINYHYPDLGIHPDRVSDSFGRQILIGWSSDDVPVVDVITLPDQTRLEYGYSRPKSDQKRLESVVRKSADGSVLWGRTYHYEDTRFVFSLTGISDHLGARIATYAYDTGNRVSLSEGAEGANRVTIGYYEKGEDQSRRYRIVTNPLGLEQTYEFFRDPLDTTNTPPELGP